MKYLIIFILAIATLVLSIKLQETLKPKKNSHVEEVESAFSSTPESETESVVSGWIANYDTMRGVASFEKNIRVLGEIMPVVFKLNTSLKIESADFPNVEWLIRVAHDNNVKIIASVTNELDGVRIHRFLNDSGTIGEGLDKLTNYMNAYGFDGIDLDFENIPVEDSEAYVNFIKDLKQKLGDKELSVTVQAQTSNLVTGQNLGEIGKAADTVRVMAYDFHTMDTEAGPIIGIDTLEQVLEVSTAKIPVEKIAICFPTYGYDWSSGNSYSMQFDEIQSLVEGHPEASIQTDSKSKSKHLVYYIGKFKHDVWYEDNETLELKINLAKKYGVGQFCFWRLGGEDARIWRLFENLRLIEEWREETSNEFGGEVYNREWHLR